MKTTDLLATIREAVKTDDRYFERYIIEDVAGFGGESIVFRVRDDFSGNKHALKIIPIPKNDKNISDKILKQVGIWKEFQNITTHVLDLQLVDRNRIEGIDVVYIVTRHSDIGSLLSFIEKFKRNEAITPSVFFKMINGLFEGFFAPVKARESASGGENSDIYFHGDIKPQNAIIFRDGEGYTPRIIDFGISASSIDEISGYSLPYAAPELISGEITRLNTASELYSFGVTCYEFLFGRVPHPINIDYESDQNENTAVYYSKIISSRVIDYTNPIFDIGDDLFQKFVILLEKMLNIDHGDRSLLQMQYVEQALKELSTAADMSRAISQRTSYVGKAKLIWNPSVHSFFGEREYFFLIKGKAFTKNLRHAADNFMNKNGIFCFSIYLVLGDYDYILKFWSKKSMAEISELARDSIEFSKVAVMSSQKVIYISYSNKIKTWENKYKNCKHKEVSSMIREALRAGNEGDLIRNGTAISLNKLSPDKIHFFTLIEMAPAEAGMSGIAFDALSAQILEITNKVATNIVIYEVVSSDMEKNAKIVVEFHVKDFKKIIHMISGIVEYFSSRGHDFNYKTFIDVSSNPKLCDDGEFLGEIIR